MPSTMQNSKDKIKWQAVLFWLVVWALTSSAIGNSIILVSPIAVLERLLSLFWESSFWLSVISTTVRITSGFIIGVITGTLFAVLAWNFKPVRHLLFPLMQTIKAVPVASFVILALIWFSVQSLAIFISFLIVFPVVYTNMLTGIENIDKELLEMSKLFQVPFSKRLRYIYFFEVLPYFRAATSVTIGLSWKSGVAAEVIGISTNTIGGNLLNAKIYFDTAGIFAWTLTVVILSIFFEKLFILCLDKITVYAGRST